MTTCSQAAQSYYWPGGTYIDWTAVDAFLHGEYVNWASSVSSAPTTFQEVVPAFVILDALEMLHGPAVLVTYPTTSFPNAASPFFSFVPHFTLAEIQFMLQRVVEAQQHTQSSVNQIPSRNIGWWLPANHHIVFAAQIYLMLRRNPAGVTALAALVPPVSVTGLEHKLLPVTDQATTTLEWGGGLTNFMAWAAEMASASAIPGDISPPPWGQTNFWGELIGVVAFCQAMADLTPQFAPASLWPTLVLLNPAIGMGASLASAFGVWRERASPGSPSGPGPAFLATPGPSVPPPAALPWSEWAGPANASWPLTLAAAVADPAAGQDWDCSLHQLTRAVNALFHLGYVFTPQDQALIVTRLQQWATPATEAWAPASSMTCSIYPIPTTDLTVVVPADRYLWDSFVACQNNLAVPVPVMVDMLAAAVALVQSGVVDSPPTVASPPFASGGDVQAAAVTLCKSILKVVASLYRGGPTAGWAGFDERDPSNFNPPDLMDGVYPAVAILRLLDRPAIREGVQTITPTLPGTATQQGLGAFLHLFGGRIGTIAPAHPWPAQPTYTPG